MTRKKFSSMLLAVTTAFAVLTFGAGSALAAHPDIPLYTYEEVASQFSMDGTNPFPAMPVMVDSNLAGMPYSPKATCGNCHNGTLYKSVPDGFMQGNMDPSPITDAAGTPISTPLVSYADMEGGAFHAQLGKREWKDEAGTSAQGGKAWTQSLAMFGKW